MLVPAPLLHGAQTVINRVLSLDPVSMRRVSALEGKVIKVAIEAPDTDVFLMFLHDEVELSRFYDVEPDTTVSGSSFAMMSLLRDSDALFDGTVTVSGDVGLAGELKQLMDELDVDWEEQLSGIVGDGPAHQIFRMAGGLMQLFEQGSDRLREQTGGFLRERADVAVSRAEATEFCNAIDTLRSDVDRLEAKFEQYESSIRQPE